MSLGRTECGSTRDVRHRDHQFGDVAWWSATDGVVDEKTQLELNPRILESWILGVLNKYVIHLQLYSHIMSASKIKSCVYTSDNESHLKCQLIANRCHALSLCHYSVPNINICVLRKRMTMISMLALEYVDEGIIISTLAPRVFSVDVANVQNVLNDFWKERVLLRSFQYYF